MKEAVIVASVASGLGALVLGLFLAREIPKKVHVQTQAPQQIQTSQEQAVQSKLPSYFYLNPYRYQGSSGYVAFKDDLAYGMKAFAEYRGKNIELEADIYRENFAVFNLPEELGDVNTFLIYAVNRNGKKSEPEKLFSLDGVLVDAQP